MGEKRAVHRRGYWEYNKTELSTLTTHELPHEDKLDSLQNSYDKLEKNHEIFTLEIFTYMHVFNSYMWLIIRY